MRRMAPEFVGRKRLDESYQQIQQRLSKLSNDQFDREFMKVAIDRDRDIEQMLAARVSKGSGEDKRPQKAAGATSDEPTLDAKVNQWATSTLSEVRAHLKAAEQVLGRLDQA